jgi:RND family efflux transporter MFP subunit
MEKKLSLGVVMLCAMLTFTACSKKAAVVQESVAATPIEVTVVNKSLIKNEYVYSGKVKPVNEVNVLSTVSGTVDQVHFNVGDKVAKGDILFTMKTDDIINNINTLNASLNSAEANIGSAKTSLELANGASMQSQIESAKGSLSNSEIAISNAKIAVSNAELALKNAQTNFDNNKALYEASAISKNAFEQVETAYNQAQNAYNQAQNSYQQAIVGNEQAKEAYNIVANKMPQENQKKAEAAFKVAQASKESVLAQIATAQKSLRDANVMSPIDGVVTACNVKAGTVLSQSMAPFTIIDMNKVSISVSVSEQLINSIHLGDEVGIKIASVSAEKLKGEITSINPASNTTGTYDVKIDIDNASGVLKSGMLGEVSFTREKSDNTIVIPRSAVITKDGQSYVFIEQNGVAKKVVVATGVDNGDKIEVISGISENMNLITTGQNYVTDGGAVSVSSNRKGE